MVKNLHKYFQKKYPLFILLAQTPNEIPQKVEPIPPKPITITDVIVNIIIYILKFSAALAVLFIIIGGIRFIISAGNQNAADNAKKMIFYAILGLIVIIFSFVIVNFVQTELAPVIVP